MAWAPCSQHTGATTTTSWLPCDSGIPGNTLNNSMAFLALAMLCLPLVGDLHIGHLASMGRGSGTASHATHKGCPTPPFTSLPGAGSCRAPALQSCPCTYLPKAAQARRYALPSSLPSHRAAQPWAGGRHARAVLLWGAQLPFSHPSQGHGSHQLQPPAATSLQWPAAVQEGT